MVRRSVFLLMALGWASVAAADPAAAPAKGGQGPRPSKSGLLPVNGLQIYYEVYGDLGQAKVPPLLLLHGAFFSSESMKPLARAFWRKRPVIVFDAQGHGRTADAPRKMTYEQFGDDAAAVLDALKVERADVLGYSQGGGAALQLAVRHPKRVNKLVSLAATYRRDGWYPAVYKAIETLTPQVFAGTPVEAAFKKLNPDPKAFAEWVEKVRVLNLNDQNLSDAQMRSFPAKTMVLIGDADGVKPEHAVAMFKLRGGGSEEAAASGQLTTVPPARLAVLPATSHLGIGAMTKELEAIVTPFLEDAQPLQAVPF